MEAPSSVDGDDGMNVLFTSPIGQQDRCLPSLSPPASALDYSLRCSHSGSNLLPPTAAGISLFCRALASYTTHARRRGGKSEQLTWALLGVAIMYGILVNRVMLGVAIMYGILVNRVRLGELHYYFFGNKATPRPRWP